MIPKVRGIDTFDILLLPGFADFVLLGCGTCVFAGIRKICYLYTVDGRIGVADLCDFGMVLRYFTDQTSFGNLILATNIFPIL
jgi:hypothetical protein